MAYIDSPESARSFLRTYWSGCERQADGRKFPPPRHIRQIIESQRMCLSIEQASRYSDETRARRQETIRVFEEALPLAEADEAEHHARLDARMRARELDALADLDAVRARIQNRG